MLCILHVVTKTPSTLFKSISLCLFFIYFLSLQVNMSAIESWNTMEDLFDSSKIHDIEDQHSISFFFLYVDEHDDIIKITKHCQEFKHNTQINGLVDKDLLIKIIQDHTLNRNGSKYLFDKLLLYHVPIQKDEIKNVHLDDNWKSHFNDNLFEVNIYTDCIVPKSLQLFHDINSFFVFYKEKPVLKSSLKKGNKSKHTKRVRFNQHNLTKKKL